MTKLTLGCPDLDILEVHGTFRNTGLATVTLLVFVQQIYGQCQRKETITFLRAAPLVLSM
jgi:hypothetical protein